MSGLHYETAVGNITMHVVLRTSVHPRHVLRIVREEMFKASDVPVTAESIITLVYLCAQRVLEEHPIAPDVSLEGMPKGQKIDLNL